MLILFLFLISVQGDNPGNISMHILSFCSQLWLYLILSKKATTNIPGCEGCSMTYINHGNRTGYQCHYEDGTAVRTRFGSTEYEYPECVPMQYELTRKSAMGNTSSGKHLDSQILGDIKKYCCFWSPDLGCTALVGDTSPDEISKSCNRCRDLCDYQQVDDIDDDNSARDPNSEHISIILLALHFLFRLGLLP